MEFKIKKGYTYGDVSIVPAPYSRVRSRKDVNLCSKISKNHKVKLPIISAPMDTITGYDMCEVLSKEGAIGCLHRFLELNEYSKICKDLNQYCHPSPICVSIGVTGDYLKRFKIACDNFIDIVVIDIANGSSIAMECALAQVAGYRQEHYLLTGQYVDIIVGNIATGDQLRNILSWGIPFEGCRAGISGGAVCSTFSSTMVYVPLITMIMDIKAVIDELAPDISLIADGGIKKAGDVCVALAAGADCVMIGSMFSATDETPNSVYISPDGIKYKEFRGSASFNSKLDRKDSTRFVEGVSEYVKCKGSVINILHELEDGLRSCFSYCNAFNIDEFQRNVRFIEITNNGYNQGMPHINK
jgi:IMP dehydrogenase